MHHLWLRYQVCERARDAVFWRRRRGVLLLGTGSDALSSFATRASVGPLSLLSLVDSESSDDELSSACGCVVVCFLFTLFVCSIAAAAAAAAPKRSVTGASDNEHRVQVRDRFRAISPGSDALSAEAPSRCVLHLHRLSTSNQFRIFISLMFSQRSKSATSMLICRKVSFKSVGRAAVVAAKLMSVCANVRVCVVVSIMLLVAAFVTALIGTRAQVAVAIATESFGRNRSG